MYKSGDEIEIQIWNTDLSQYEWKPGIFMSYVPAMDREYR